MPERFKLLKGWLEHSCKIDDFNLKPASGDASFRRYFRVHQKSGETFIAMDAPPDKENCHPFIQIAHKLTAAGIHAPEIYHQDLDLGFILLEDLGENLYLDSLNERTVEPLYADALAALIVMQANVKSDDVPVYDRDLLMQEMMVFSHWLLEVHLRCGLRKGEQQMLQTLFDFLADSALAQPQVFVHRDYHSRNLVLGSTPVPGVIDFQDAVAGPITYDLVSLLRDCYIKWPPDKVDQWAMGYYESCVETGLLLETEREDFLRWFDLMGVQRHLKAAGIFARLNHRDGKSGYLKDIPRTLGYIVDVSERRDAIKPLARLLQTRVLPGL